MNTKRLAKLILAGLLAVATVFSLFACAINPTGGNETSGTEAAPPEEEEKNPIFEDGDFTYNTYTSLSPSNWNELTYKDNNDTQIMSYIGSSFFSYDFKYDENGEIVPGEFVMKYEAATKLEDVSKDYVGDEWGVPADATSYAYKITLRDDLKWDNGDPIVAGDFVYTMQEQLNPDFQNYRADSFYVGSTVLVNALNYAKQGQSGWFASSTCYTTYSADLDSTLVFSLAAPSEDRNVECYFRTSMGFPASYDAVNCAAYVNAYYVPEFTADIAAKMEGKTLAEIKADPAMKAAWDALIGWWQTEPNEELHFFVTDYTYPEIEFDKVGIKALSDTELVIILAKPLALLKEDGTLSYKAAYNMASLPLVHKATYEACKQKPQEGGTLWTSNYNSSVETTRSWGPYKLTFFQEGKQYILERNENWYGYNVKENFGLYQTDKIVCDTVKEWKSAWTLFLAGKIDGIGIDVSVADDYKGSDKAYFTPDDFVASLQLQSNTEQLAARGEAEGVNKNLLGYTDFRKALSLAINRADFATKTTTSSLAGFGLFNSMHYYDVENGGVYRNSDDAKKVLCDIYAVDYTKYENLDKAVAAITGYNLDEARALVTSAYNQAKADGKITDTDKVKFTFGTGAVNDTVTRRYEYIKAAWVELVKTTPLEGRLDLEIKDFSDAWADDFRAGKYDVCMGGWTGAAWDPGYFLLAYLSADYMYSAAWPTDKVTMTFTMKGVGKDGADVTETMTLLEWYDCLNGASDAKYNWSESALENSKRLQLIAALEKEVLKVYYTVPLYNNFSASMLSYKVDYITYEYNTFLGYGGMKYMTFNFNDTEWAAEVAKNNGELNYK